MNLNNNSLIYFIFIFIAGQQLKNLYKFKTDSFLLHINIERRKIIFKLDLKKE